MLAATTFVGLMEFARLAGRVVFLVWVAVVVPSVVGWGKPFEFGTRFLITVHLACNLGSLRRKEFRIGL